MKYKYYKDKYLTVTIKLDREKDKPVIDYLKRERERGFGPKAVFCNLAASAIFGEYMLANSGLFKLEDDIKLPEALTDE